MARLARVNRGKLVGVGGDKIAGLLETGNGNIAASILTSIKALQTELQNTGTNIGTNMEGAGEGTKAGLNTVSNNLASLDANNKAALDVLAANV